VKRPGPAAPKPAAKKPAKKRAAKNPLTYLQLSDPREALLISPARYVDCTRFVESVHDVEPEETAMFRLRLTGEFKGFDRTRQLLWKAPETFRSLAGVPKNLYWKTKRLEIMAVDQRGSELTISSFGGIAQWSESKADDVLHVTGSYKQFGKRIYFNVEATVPEKAIGSVWVQYGGVPGQISGDRVALAVSAAKLDVGSWRHCAGRIVGECGLAEPELLQKAGSSFTSLIDLLKALHEPKTLQEGLAAHEDARRISALAIQASALRSVARPAHPKSPIMLDPQEVARLAATQKETMTQDQQTVVTRICELLGQPKAMTALLSGDVGTGKTLTYLLPAVAAHRAGAQVAVIAPTNLLADQLYQQLVGRFGNELSGVQRIESGDVIRDPRYILVGTSGLVGAAKKAGYNPNLLICDEQHKMGAATREDLQADWTHLLEVSATPIPRSLATALYDGMEILNLRQAPVKKVINSFVVDMEQKRQMIQAVRDAIAKGERCAFVYPLVSNDEDGEDDAEQAAVHTVESAFQGLEAAFPGKVVMLHGKMSQDELRAGIAKMRTGERLIMVASTVIETGLDIPSISLMVVRNADRFGVSQLHQLRGRLVRNGGTGNFLMAVESFADFPDKEDGTINETLQRLDAVASTTDGYELAERDLLLRGFGDFTGLDQTGSAKTVFRLVDLKVEDFMARKLRTLKVEPVERPTQKGPASAKTNQNGLF
jgi:ATP-dependent DNA helicase RecG